jgi:Protein of unknown function (DUF3990)
MAWTNGAFIVYHGCDQVSASAIQANGIDLTKCRPRTDFGVGFYASTNRHQAENWANTRVRRITRRSRPATAAIVEFEVDRNLLAACTALCFVTEGWKPNSPIVNSDYWQFISYCRGGGGNHLLQPGPNYDVVWGPVSLYPQILTINNCDQISFHSNKAILATSVIGVISAPPGSGGLFP